MSWDYKETPDQIAVRKSFVDALRECLGLEPLYAPKDSGKSSARFWDWPGDPVAADGRRKRVGR